MPFDTIELPNPSGAMALNKRSIEEVEENLSESLPTEQRPKKVFRRSDTVQVVNMSNLVYEHLVVTGGLLKYKPSSSIHELRLNLTTKEHKVIVQKASLELNDRSKFELDMPGGSILADLSKFISGVAAAPLVQKRLEEGHEVEHDPRHRGLPPELLEVPGLLRGHRQRRQHHDQQFRGAQRGHVEDGWLLRLGGDRAGCALRVLHGQGF